MNFPMHVISAIVVLSFILGFYLWFRLSLNLAALNWGQQKTNTFRAVSALILTLWWIAALIGSRSDHLFLAPQAMGSVRLVVIGVIAIAVMAAVALLTLLPPYRQLIDVTPPQWLILIYILRANFGFILLVLYEMDLLPVQFALAPGYGDITTGLLAPIVAYALHQNLPHAYLIGLAWNTFGLLDLLNVLRLANLRLIPYSVEIGTPILIGMLPLFTVPLFIIWHIYLFRILLRKKPALGAARQT